MSIKSVIINESPKTLSESSQTECVLLTPQLSEVKSDIDVSQSSQQEVYISWLWSGIAVLSMNRPNSLNSFSRSMTRQLHHNLHHLRNDSELRVLIIRSTVPGVFSAGSDLKERVTMNEEEIKLFVTELRRISTVIHDFPYPTIAAIDGSAIGGGLELCLATDLRIIASNAKLGLVETKLAVIPGAGGTQRLSRLIPIHLAKELIFTGRLIDGNQAYKMGMCNYSVQQNDMGDAAYRRAIELAKEMLGNGPIALKLAKLAINKGSEVDINTGLSIEAMCYNQTVGTKDRLEGLSSFIEKRLPIYRGQ